MKDKKSEKIINELEEDLKKNGFSGKELKTKRKIISLLVTLSGVLEEDLDGFEEKRQETMNIITFFLISLPDIDSLGIIEVIKNNITSGKLKQSIDLANTDLDNFMENKDKKDYVG